jgi:diacylglycerol kinase family enzyme
MRLALIHNPKSGDDDHEAERLLELLTRAGHDVHYRTSMTPWHTVLDDEPELVVIAGGDGTVAEVVRAASGRTVPMTILPTGTANNIAGFLGLNGIPLDQLVAAWPSGRLCPFDLGVARGEWGTSRFLESVGVGLLADLMRATEDGGAAYVNELAGREARIGAAVEVLTRMLHECAPVRCDLELDGEHSSGEFLLVEVLNFGAAGPNLRMAPHADGSDGVLDVVTVEARQREWLRGYLERVRTEQPTTPLPVRHARHVSLRCAAPCVAHLDDELQKGGGGKGVTLEATVEPHAVTFLVPEVGAAHRRA